jgi:hypothetical protein
MITCGLIIMMLQSNFLLLCNIIMKRPPTTGCGPIAGSLRLKRSYFLMAVQISVLSGRHVLHLAKKADEVLRIGVG